ncbi:hypothetical protein WKW50_16550 [Ochrobactrum sp. GPK 3]
MREARETLHRDMSSPALYFTEEDYSDAIEVSVRMHEKWVASGDLKGTNFNYAEVEDVAPRLIFQVSEVSPKRGAFVSIEPGLAYRVDSVDPEDDLTVTVIAIRLSKSETVGFPVPTAT